MSSPSASAVTSKASPALKAPAAESNRITQRSDDDLAQIKSRDLDAKVQEVKRKLEDHQEQIKSKRQKKEKWEDQLERQCVHLVTLQQEIDLTKALLEKEMKVIANNEAQTQGLEQELASIELERKLEARKAARLDIEDWEMEHLIKPFFKSFLVGGEVMEWIEGKATLTTMQHVKSVLFDELTGAGDAQMTGLLKRLRQHIVLSATGSSEDPPMSTMFQPRPRPRRGPRRLDEAQDEDPDGHMNKNWNWNQS